jgi:hypothetical protein
MGIFKLRVRCRPDRAEAVAILKGGYSDRDPNVTLGKVRLSLRKTMSEDPENMPFKGKPRRNKE